MKNLKNKRRLIVSGLLLMLMLTQSTISIVNAAEPKANIGQVRETPGEEKGENKEVEKEKTDTVSGAVPLLTTKEEILSKEELIEEEGMEYVLGRPMTEAEEEEQRHLVEKYTSMLVPLEADKAVQSLLADSEDMVRAAMLPSAYDARESGNITSVKNQNPYGICWAFSSISLAEASLINNSILTRGEADLSELHLAYYTFRFVTDPLGGTEGDNNYRSSVDSILNDGGNYNRAIRTMSSWIGTVHENTVPFEMAPAELPQTVEAAYGHNNAILKNAYEINKNDTSLVKQAIIDYGTVGIMYCAVSNSAYYNVNTAAQYCDKKYQVNHAVAIVGWDDEYSVNNFNTKPENNGAWLVKNSWGEGFGNTGYFWLSYEDASINETFFVLEMSPADKYQNNYQYDGSGAEAYVGLSDHFEVANVFTAHANNGKKEVLEAVSFVIDAANVNYNIQIYKNPSDSSNPTSGTAMLSTPQTGNVTFEGYYSIELKEEVELAYGDVFAVVIAFDKPNESIMVGRENSNSGSTASAKAGQSFYNNGMNWVDFGVNHNANLRIKAFTVNINETGENVPVTGIDMPKKAGVLEPKESVVIQANVIPVNATNRKIKWSSSDAKVATVDNTGKVTAGQIGTATITALTEDGNYSAKYELEVKEKKIYTGLSITGASKIEYIGSSVQFEAMVYPTNAPDRTVTWNTSNAKVAEVDGNGLVTATGIGTAIITAISNGDNNLKESVSVNVPDNKHNQVRSFVNRMYTVALNRKADSAGAEYWTEQLLTGKKDGASVAKGFVLSAEMDKRKLSNSQYVDMLYLTFFDRNADANGKAYWLNLLENGVSRAYVFRGFCHSKEFSNICSSYNIKRGTVTLTENRDQNHNITMYVYRCYERTLNRKPDVKGLNFWAGEILSKRRTPTDVAGNFVFSTEFKNKKLSDREYVKVLYRMFFDREYNAPGTDPNGINFWLEELKSGRRDRYKVFLGFANSQEFKNVLKTFNL